MVVTGDRTLFHTWNVRIFHVLQSFQPSTWNQKLELKLFNNRSVRYFDAIQSSFEQKDPNYSDNYNNKIVSYIYLIALRLGMLIPNSN